MALSIVAIYILGSGICGGARNPAMLIAGRAVQGIGSGGKLEFCPNSTPHSSLTDIDQVST